MSKELFGKDKTPHVIHNAAKAFNAYAWLAEKFTGRRPYIGGAPEGASAGDHIDTDAVDMRKRSIKGDQYKG